MKRMTALVLTAALAYGSVATATPPLDRVLAPYGLKVGPEADCLDIRSNLEEHGLRLCPVAP